MVANRSATIPNPSKSGTTLAQVTKARSRLPSDGAELATAQPMKKCVIGLMNVGVQITQIGNSGQFTAVVGNFA